MDMATFNEIQDKIGKKKSDVVATQEKLYIATQKLNKYIEAIEHNKRTTKPPKSISSKGGEKKIEKKIGNDGKLDPIIDAEKIDLQLIKLTKAKNELSQTLQSYTAELLSLYNDLWLLGDPQELINNFKASVPIILFPIRLETRFLQYPGQNKKYLGLRFFPDDVFITTHERLLTAEEITAGKEFWNEQWKVIGDPNKNLTEAHKGGWQVLSSAHGHQRAAFISLKTKPTNWPIDLSVVPGVIEFPVLEAKDGSWSLPARSYIVPDKFVARLYNGSSIKEIPSNPITAYPLILGPDPMEEEIFEGHDDGTVSIQKNIEWLYDFDKAVECGMAIKIELSNTEYDTGFDKITVIGLNYATSPNSGKQLLEELVDAHHYGPGGISLIPQGTPTNNSKEKPSGYTKWKSDPELTFQIEQNEALIQSPSGTQKPDWQDGHWLSMALGTDIKRWEHIAFSNNKDRMEASAMNSVLWDATLGYYLRHMLVEWNTLQPNTITNEDIEKIKEFFTNHVSGRGSLPALRIGNQPYGMLPTTAFSKINWLSSETHLGKLSNVLEFFKADWQRFLPNLISAGEGNDSWQQDFLDILGLNSGTVEYHNRVGFGPLGYYFFLKQTAQDPDSWLDERVNSSNNINDAINNLISSNDILSKNTRMSMMTWFPFTAKFRSPLVSMEEVSEHQSLVKNYINYLSDPDNIGSIIKEYLTKIHYDNSLLYRLLRHSLLLTIWDILWKINEKQPWVEAEMLNYEEGEMCKSVWYKFTDEKGNLDFKYALVIVNASSYKSYCKTLKKLLNNSDSIATERLERLLTEHLDVCTYRLDAWYSGLVDYKLKAMRSANPEGIYLGAYGWLFNVRKGGSKVAVAENDIPDLFTNNNHTFPLTYEEGNAGFIHAPSIAQAVTGAVLREGYLSKGQKAMEVDLTSNRVRLALETIEGLSNGQELGALLGYRFERYLHDHSGGGMELDKFIYDYRKEFSIAPTMYEVEESNTEITEANNVVNGLALIQKKRQAPLDYYGANISEKVAIDNAMKELEEILDAIADLTMAEGVHQAVLGNHPRANAILNALGEGKMIPKPEIIETPRTGITFTQRMCLFINKNKQPSTSIWDDSTISYRKVNASEINKWLEKVIGDPGIIKCNVGHDEKDNEGNTISHFQAISLHDLKISAIDFVYLSKLPYDDKKSELTQRIEYYYRKENEVITNSKVTINYQMTGTLNSGIKSFFDVIILCRKLHKAITASEVMMPYHAQTSVDNIDLSSTMQSIKSNFIDKYNSINISDWIDELAQQIVYLDAINIDSISDSEKSKIIADEEKLLKYAGLGIQGCLPSIISNFTAETINFLITKRELIKVELEKRKIEAEKFVENLTDDIKMNIEAYTQAIKSILGKDLPILPTFVLPNHTQILNSYADKNGLLRNDEYGLAMEDLLLETSKVREKVYDWNLLNVMNESHNEETSLTLHPIQLPYQVNDQWIGIEYKSDETNFAAETLSFVCHIPYDFGSNANDEYCGLIIDEWVEKIPNRSEITGVSFNYNEPESEAPQAILVCVPPHNDEKWKWEDLVNTIDETMEMMKLRSIDPDMLARNPGSKFNSYLPVLVFGQSTDHKQSVNLNLLSN